MSDETELTAEERTRLLELEVADRIQQRLWSNAIRIVTILGVGIALLGFVGVPFMVRALGRSIVEEIRDSIAMETEELGQRLAERTATLDILVPRIEERARSAQDSLVELSNFGEELRSNREEMQDIMGNLEILQSRAQSEIERREEGLEATADNVRAQARIMIDELRREFDALADEVLPQFRPEQAERRAEADVRIGSFESNSRYTLDFHFDDVEDESSPAWEVITDQLRDLGFKTQKTNSSYDDGVEEEHFLPEELLPDALSLADTMIFYNRDSETIAQTVAEMVRTERTDVTLHLGESLHSETVGVWVP